MSDFQVQVGGDFSELLRGFQQLEARAQQSGNAVGKGLADGIQGFSSKSIAALQSELSRLEQRQVKVAVDSTAFEKTGKRITEIKALIAEIERRRLTVGVDDRSITALQSKLAQLQSKQTRLAVDSREFADAQSEINALEKELNDVSRRKLLINADPSSLIALQAKLGDLQGELGRVAIGSQRFQELTTAIQAAERELSRAGESADQFRILDGVVQGIAFSLSNSVVDGAQRALSALGGVVAEFGRLDTELRKAAAASGEAGAYESLARSVDQVGIEAAGTTLEVAQLNTELIRGGLTVDQANASLAAIVRGAEATGTSFAAFGSVVSASLKSFGLEARDAQRVVDALVTGANASAASAEGLGLAFKYAAPVAKLLGVSIEDLALAAGLLTNAGIDASEAGVTLRNGFSKLASAAPKAGGAMQDLTGQSAMAAKAMRSLGVDIYNTDGTLKPMETTLLQLKGAFEKLDPASKIRLAANLFGGEDDGAKWLALLNQSEAEIRRMAQTMANTKGAADVARDAMTGFELKLKQLDGTVGSLAITFGSVAAGALIPFVDAANTIVGAITGLPGPVKTLGAGMVLLTGATVAATAAQIAFTRALQAEAVQGAISAVGAFAGALRTQLAGALSVAAVGFSTLATAIKGFSAQSFFASIAQLAAAIRTQLAGAATVAITAFSALAQSIKSGAFASALQNLIGQVGLVTAGIARFAATVGPIALVVGIVAKAMEGGAEAGERYKAANDTISEALVKLRDELGKTDIKLADSRNAIQKLWDSFGEGARVIGDIDATNKITESIAKLNQEASGYLGTIKQTGSLTDEQRSKSLAFVAALQSSSGAVQQLVKEYETLASKAALIGDDRQAEVYREAATLLQQQANAANNTSAALSKKAQITNQDIVATGKATEVTKAQADAEKQLADVIRTQPVRNLDAQLTAGQSLLGLTQALSEQEQSRFAVTKAGIEYELSQAEKRKASESTIRRIKDELNKVEIAALRARYGSLQQEQALQRELLKLSQEKARLESNLAVQEQNIAVLKAAQQLQQSINGGKQAEINAARANLDLQTAILGTRYESAGLLSRTQELENRVLTAQQAAAENTARAALAQKGITAELQSSAGYSTQLVGTTASIASNAQEYAAEARRAAEQQAGIATAAQQASTQTAQAAGNARALASNTTDGVRKTTELANSAGQAKGSLDGASKAAGGVKAELGGATEAAAKAAAEAGKVGASAADSANRARPLVEALDSAGANAQEIATARMAANLSAASGSAGGLRNAMAAAAGAARTFYEWLAKASGLPGSRWTGGPVEAGQTVRINDGPAGRSLGQESFLTAAGKLSLINRPANSLWTPPTSGVVIPAGVTEQLKARGAFDASRAARAAVASRSASPLAGGSEGELAANLARQALAIGKLQQSVDQLVEKDWNVQLRVRSDANGPSYLNTLNRML